jgi:hypothetical protein
LGAPGCGLHAALLGEQIMKKIFLVLAVVDKDFTYLMGHHSAGTAAFRTAQEAGNFIEKNRCGPRVEFKVLELACKAVKVEAPPES